MSVLLSHNDLLTHRMTTMAVLPYRTSSRQPDVYSSNKGQIQLKVNYHTTVACKKRMRQQRRHDNKNIRSHEGVIIHACPKETVK